MTIAWYTLASPAGSGAMLSGSIQALPCCAPASTKVSDSANAGARCTSRPVSSTANELPSNTSSSWPPVRLT